jgi:hypothetical protein
MTIGLAPATRATRAVEGVSDALNDSGIVEQNSNNDRADDKSNERSDLIVANELESHDSDDQKQEWSNVELDRVDKRFGWITG